MNNLNRKNKYAVSKHLVKTYEQIGEDRILIGKSMTWVLDHVAKELNVPYNGSKILYMPDGATCYLVTLLKTDV